MLILATVLAGLFASQFAASTAKAARTEFFGIAAGQLNAQDREGMAGARVQTARFMLKWREIENVRGTYDWSDRDWFIGGLASQRIRPVPFVWGSPKWVGNGDPRQPPLGTAADRQAWRSFLRAAVARYGPGGTYWAPGGKYEHDYGTSATPLPIKSWQVWNEVNLKKYFSPGSTTQQAANKYANLLAISHDAIKAKDSKATIVLAGMPNTSHVAGSSTAWDFLNALYKVAGVKTDFDAAALHPYACDLDQVRTGLQKFSAVMKNRGDGATPLWITEFAWGSGPPDKFCKNKGLTGQRDLLVSSYRMFLQNRTAWNIQRVFWFLWRDPDPASTYGTYCSFCDTAGLLNYDHTPKPALNAFKGFSAETTPPVVSITAGPAEGSATNDAAPTFSLASSEAGSTFVCRYDSSPFAACSSPYTRATSLADGVHSFSVKAIDAPGNESTVVSRSFTVDTKPPAAPPITRFTPPSPANNNGPKVVGSAEAGSTVRLYKSWASTCTFSPVASGTSAQFATPGLGVSVADNSTTLFSARAVDAAGNISTCSVASAYVEDSTPPQTTITDGPSGPTTDTTPTFTFSSSETGTTFECRVDSDPFAACSGPDASHTPSSPLSIGSHTFEVQATDRANNTDPTPAIRTFTVAF